MKWITHKIDYEYGTAVLLTRKKPKDVIDLFYDLAEQCFGIRKSLGEIKLLDSGEVANLDKVELPTDKSEENHPELYANPLSKMMKAMCKTNFTIPRTLEKKAKYILVHSGGDMIAWSDLKTKIKSEFD